MTKFLNIGVQEDLLNRIEAYREKTGASIAKMVRLAIDQFLKAQGF